MVFTTVAYRESDKLTAVAYIDKVPALLTLQAGTRWAEIDPRIAPEETEPVLNKPFASGCVRATAVDALQYGLRPVVPREAVGDRNERAHQANLYDVDAKYGDVVSTAEVLVYLEEIAAALTG